MAVKNKNTLLIILLLLVLESVVLWWLAHSTDKRMRAELLQQARLAARGCSFDLIKELSGSEKDLDSAAYQRIKYQLTMLRETKKNCRFLYLLGRHVDGRVFFFADSLSPDAKDYAPPGMVYDEVPESYIATFETQKDAVVGPVTDRWGTLITALVPIVSPDTHTLLAVMGMDVEARLWNQEIINHCIGPALIIFLSILLFLIIVSLRDSEKKYRFLFANMLNGFAYHKVLFNGDTPVDFIYLDVNDAFEKLTGLKDVVGKKVSEVIPGIRESDPELLNIYFRVALTGQPETFELYMESLCIWVSVSTYSPEKGYFVATFDVITKRKLAETERENNIRLFEIINKENDFSAMMTSLLNFFHEIAECDAVGIRLRDGNDFPYYGTKGFSDDFVASERHLCVKDLDGQMLRDEIGNPVLECMCGNVLCGRTDPSKPFFTEFGSFISNNTTKLLAETTEEDRQARTRNRCNGEGYESVLLVPIRTGGETFGLLQFNDYREDFFSRRFIDQAENFSNNIAIALGKKKAEKALRNSEEKYRLLFSTFPLGITITDKSGKIVETNNTAEKLLGISKNEHHSRTIDDPGWQVLAPTGEPMNIDDYGSVRALKENCIIENAEMGVRKPDGEIVWLNVTAAPLSLENYGIVATYGDVTKQKQAEDALKKSEGLHRAILETAMDGVWIADSLGNLLSVNDAYCHMSGYSQRELLNMKVRDLEVIETEDEIIARIQRVTEQGADRFESKHRKKDGTLFDVEVSLQFLPDYGSYFIVFLRDITEKKTREEENRRLSSLLQHAQKLESIGTLAGGIAHDFNNILFPIIGLAEMLMEDFAPDSPAHESAQEIFAAGKRGSDLVKQILAFSRQSEKTMMPVRIQKILSEVLKLIRSIIPSYIEIHRDIQENCGTVNANPTQIHQIAMNLLTNAYHAVEPQNGKISISLKEIVLKREDLHGIFLEPGRYTMFTVSDTGPGIDPGIINNIFEPYFTTKAQGKGTGLGLATVYGIVKEYGGDIRVKSQIGIGTTFDVFLPLALNDAPQKHHKNMVTELLGSERIMIVDDEVSIARLETRMLESLGYKVSAYFTSIEAMAAFKANPDAYDLVMTDMNMPNMPGDQLVRNIIQVRPDIPVIICTGFSERMSEDKAEEIGVKGFLMKPILKSEMAKMIRSILDEKKQP